MGRQTFFLPSAANGRAVTSSRLREVLQICFPKNREFFLGSESLTFLRVDHSIHLQTSARTVLSLTAGAIPQRI